nr:immunoglobulin light chain junction region [Macaca mulatta]
CEAWGNSLSDRVF